MSARFEARQALAIAGKELRERVRGRWLLAAVALFTAFALAIAYFGAAQQGALGLRSVDVTVASLLSLAVYLVPLIALILGCDAIAGERERGSLALLLSLPVTRLELLVGKFLGLAAALVVSTLAGFGATGALLAASFGAGALAPYGLFVASAAALGMAFLSLALLISASVPSRSAASAAAIVAWFALVLVYDLVLLALLVAAQGRLPGVVVPALLLLNPADAFRLLNMLGIPEVARLYGLAAVVPPKLAAPAIQAAALVAWIVVPLGLAHWRFRR